MTRDSAELRTLLLGEGTAALHLIWADDRPASLVGGAATATPADLAPRAVQPLVEVLAVGHGRASGNLRHTATAVGARLRVAEVRDTAAVDPARDGVERAVEVVQTDPGSGLRVSTLLTLHGPAVRAVTTVRNGGSEALHLQAVSSVALSAPLGSRPPADVVSVEGTNEWVGENRWERVPLGGQGGLVDLDLVRHQRQDGRGAHVVASAGTWSSGTRVPSGVLTTVAGDLSLGWQIEHNGAWRFEASERLGTDDQRVLAVVALGPTDVDHHWLRTLEPDEEFTTVPVTVVPVAGGWQDAVAGLTDARRHRHAAVAAARPVPPRPREPFVVFNDYMNTVMGDPTTAKLLPLVDAAASVGAEVFCIDAGWYDDGGDWWDSVGLWEPSTRRFPDGGLRVVTDRILDRGMVPGLWLEPEVVGVRSPLAELLPDEAFLLRRGRRLVEHDRYLLDLRHADVVKRLDAVVDRLVDEFRVGYLKLDYNVTPGAGTDRDADSVGDGLLEQNRAQAAWIDGLRHRHPQLQVENCASGAMRADDALLSVSTLQSTSDQQNPLLYPPIASGALVSILPEQAANWAYPQPELTVEQNVFTLCTGLAGRLYLSGHLDRMDAQQRGLVAEAVRFARAEEGWLHRARPAWPLGLPGWTDPWVSSALADEDQTLAVVWRRGGDREVVLDLPPGELDIAFPASPPGDPWELVRQDDGRVRVVVPGTAEEPQARVVRVRRH
ncbi:glycoside hydrolase family 36 protein [Cellulomonas endometrii]|uniref:glycoside hydrolase family 36 protein n=1 Tax=Cellulomonas endometrii TaxID=3036301 RepID=UPI0024ACB075|nr:alpha-galactosidase [Cellulomonas endometrii]